MTVASTTTPNNFPRPVLAGSGDSTLEHHGTNTPTPLATGRRKKHLSMRHLHGQKVSFKLVKKVIHSDRVDGMHKLILIILADYVNEAKGNAAWPSVTTVALQAGASVRHTRRIIRELEAEGVLTTTKQAGIRGTNKYVIDVETPVDNSVGADMGVLPRADIYDTKGGHMEHVRADMGVRRIDKEHIRKDTFGGAAPPGRAATASLQRDQQNVATVGSGSAADTPQCQDHKAIDWECKTCYIWQEEQWRKEKEIWKLRHQKSSAQ